MTKSSANENGSEAENKLQYKAKFAWSGFSKEQKEETQNFAEDYLEFLRVARTERERTYYTTKLAEKKGFKLVEIGKKMDGLKPGDKIFYINRNKNIALAIIGKKPVNEKINLVGAHMDTPRIDLKIRPLYEDKKTGLALFKTHYYGGIKKYQWASIPLALTGVIAKTDGTVIKVEIGRDENDPVLMIPDLLPHLSKTVQSNRKTAEVIKAEEMNVLAGATEDEDKKAKQKFKLTILKILEDRYGIQEEDFHSAELSLVSALPPRFVGLDKSMIGAPGQDDGVCSYTSLRAIMDIDSIPEYTIITGLFDKEEIGSNGNTGAQSVWIQHVITDLMVRTGVKETLTNLHLSLANTKILSADVTASMDPSFPSVHDPKTAAIFGKGIVIMKYTGAGGKYNSSDATAEYMAKIRSIFDASKIYYQIGTLGAVDAGGGGTIAKYFAENFNADVVDAGPGVINMHSPYEITHIADVYSSYLAYKSFFLS